ncbi:MAG: hypothetical protein NZ555_16910 [Geminicoccaceae bacterium]|nr:hypothetical protein [Geminicoccaceae bacterium]MDW8371816.1 hypothetical protein [Geminicoccaceae bacterium]
MSPPSEKSEAALDEEARDACVRLALQNARQQLVSVGPIERTRPDVTLVRLQLLVESGLPRRCRCYYDHRIKLANIVD